MAEAGVYGDRDRLPWLEPYRAPAHERGRHRGAAIAALATVAAISSALIIGDWRRPATEPVPPPQVRLVMPSPEAMKLDVPEVALNPGVALRSGDASILSPARHVAASAPRRTRVRARRIVKAVPDRSSYNTIVAEQIASLPPAAPVIQSTPVPVPPAPFLPRPTVNPRAAVVRGKTAQLGLYLSAWQAETAWRSAIRDYTYLVTMPKDISVVRFGTSQRRFYRLQLGTPSRAHARQLCRNLQQIGRACTVA